MSTAIYRPNGQIIVFDAAETVVRSLPNRVTNHPIETGSNISDNIISDPKKIDVTAVVSDAAFRHRQDDSFSLGIGRSKAVLDALIEMRDLREVIKFETGDQVFSNMVLVDFRNPKDSNTGDAIRVSFSVQELDVVEKRFALVPANAADGSKNKAASEDATGKQSGKEIDKSALIQVIESAAKSVSQLGTP